MQSLTNELDVLHLEFVKELAEQLECEMRAAELGRSMEDKLKFLASNEGDGSHAIEISAHAFKQIFERLEILARENDVIMKDFVDASNTGRSLSMPSNFKCFILTLVANSKKKGNFSKEKSKNTIDGYEFRYNIEINKWSEPKKTLQFTCIVENCNIKTGYFNWV